jgi:hypothetical protein
MTPFLKDHLDVMKSQDVGCHIYWDHAVDFDDLKKAAEKILILILILFIRQFSKIHQLEPSPDINVK